MAAKNKQIIQPDSDLLHRATLRTLDGVAAGLDSEAASVLQDATRPHDATSIARAMERRGRGVEGCMLGVR